MKPIQYFSEDYLAQARKIPADAVARFLEDFRLIHAPHSKSRLISMKVPEPLLAAFKAKCGTEGVRYQTRIKELMRQWLDGGRRRP